MEKLKSSTISQNPLFETGSSVEVRSTDPGFDGSWYEATILETPRQMRYRYVVEYKTLLSTPSSNSKRNKKETASSLLKEKVCMSLIRPSSPCKRNRNAVFEAFQEVEAYHNDGWWPGVVLKKMDGTGDDGSSNYSVAFPLSREVFPFRAYDLRNKMVWVADDQGYAWKSADQLCNYDHNSEEELYKTTFHVGTRVEVSYDKDTYGACWFVATILQIIGRTYCLVEYDTLKADNNDSSNPSLEEVVDMQYIRPCPPMNMSEPNRSFKEHDKVEAYYNSGWFFGVVSTVFPNSMYAVSISEQNKEVVVPFDRAALRIPSVWEDGRWDEVSQGKNGEVIHRCKGQKFKRPKARETDSLTDDNLPLKKLKKLKDSLDGDKSHHKSSPSHDKDETSPINSTAPSSENHLKSRKVHHDSTSDLKESSPVNNSVPSSDNQLKSRKVHNDSTSDLMEDHSPVKNTLRNNSKKVHQDSTSSRKDGFAENSPVNNHVPSSEKRSITRKAHHDSASNHKDENSSINNAAPSSEKSVKSIKTRRDSTSNHKPSPSDKEGNSAVQTSVRSSTRRVKFSLKSGKNTFPEAKNLFSTPTDVCHENTASPIDSVTENAEIFKDIIDLDIVNVDNGIQNGSISNEVNKENAMEHEHALSKALSNNENITPFVPCSSNNTESLDSETEMTELMESTKEVLKLFPQQPHCDPLLIHAKFVKKGLTYGLKMAFAELVKSIKHLSNNAPDEEFDERFKTLDYVEEFGFSVEQVRDRLKKLKEMRDCLMELHDKKASTMHKVEELKSEQKIKVSEVLDIDKRIAALNEERDKLMSEKKRVETEVEDLNNAAVAVEDESVLVKAKFDEIAKSSW